ncbi:hypothetical protein S83_064551 [Arachis hypogaea]
MNSLVAPPFLPLRHQVLPPFFDELQLFIETNLYSHQACLNSYGCPSLRNRSSDSCFWKKKRECTRVVVGCGRSVALLLSNLIMLLCFSSFSLCCSVVVVELLLALVVLVSAVLLCFSRLSLKFCGNLDDGMNELMAPSMGHSLVVFIENYGVSKRQTGTMQQQLHERVAQYRNNAARGEWRENSGSSIGLSAEGRGASG